MRIHRAIPTLLPSFLRSGLAFLAGLVLVAATGGCGGEDGEKLANKRPFVELTGGPAQLPPLVVDGDTVDVQRDKVYYSVEILWTGWDDDGIIDHYQYAVDIPEDLRDEIDNPEDVGIAWVDTTAFRASFRFTTTLPDEENGAPVPTQYRGNHTFYVRAVDNDGAISRAAYVDFTATTVTPQTRITVPGTAEEADVLLIGRQFNVVWEGVDPDNPDPRRLPAWYEWKIKQMPTSWNPIGQDAQYAVDFFAADAPWNRISADTTSLRLSLQTGFPYIFAIRGIDEAGGVETLFFKGRNTLILQSSERNPGTPELIVRERTLGEVTFPGTNLIEFEMAINNCVQFEFTGDASDYGGVVQGYNYGIDVDPEDDGPNSNFRGWTLNRKTEPICFTTRGIHTVTVKCRDTGGGVTSGTIILRVVDFTFDNDVLYVDDFRRARSQGVTDEMMDARHLAMIEAAGISPSETRQYDAFGVGDAQSDPTPIRLSELGGYKIVLWDVLGSAISRNPLLVFSNACATGRVLQAYVAGGGGLWVFGQQVYAGFDVATNASCLANLNYGLGESATGLIFIPGDFLYEFMKIDGGGFYDVRGNITNDGMVTAQPTVEAAANGFPLLEIDRTIYTPTGPLPFCNAMFQPTFDATGGLDTLYTYVSGRSTSSMNRKPTSFRYYPTDPIPTQGPVAVFGFPLHFLKIGSAADTTGVHGLGKLMIDWLLRNQGLAAQARRSQAADPVSSR